MRERERERASTETTMAGSWQCAAVELDCSETHLCVKEEPRVWFVWIRKWEKFFFFLSVSVKKKNDVLFFPPAMMKLNLTQSIMIYNLCLKGGEFNCGAMVVSWTFHQI